MSMGYTNEMLLERGEGLGVPKNENTPMLKYRIEIARVILEQNNDPVEATEVFTGILRNKWGTEENKIMEEFNSRTQNK